MLAINGEFGLPCGVPLTLWTSVPSDICIGAFSQRSTYSTIHFWSVWCATTHIESFFSHLKGDWPHLTTITDPAAVDTELARIRGEYNTIRLHASIGYVTPDDEHH